MGSLSNPNAYSGIVKNSGGSGNDFPVNINNPQNGQLLRYNSESESLENVDSFVRLITETYEENYVATAEDALNYFDVNENDVVAGYTYNVRTLDISYNEIESNNDDVIYKLKWFDVGDELWYVSIIYSIVNVMGDNLYFTTIHYYNPSASDTTSLQFPATKSGSATLKYFEYVSGVNDNV